MIIVTKDRGALRAKAIYPLIDKAHDFLVLWEADGNESSFEHMRKSEIEVITNDCERCQYFIDTKCTEPFDYVNKYTGEKMCSANTSSIKRSDYENSPVDSTHNTVTKPTVQELKETVKKIDHFRPCPKGGK
jgi:hypothetical protein